MRRIEVEDNIYDAFEQLPGDGSSGKLKQLVNLAKRAGKDSAERKQQIALVILEDIWFDFDDNPGQASNAPFLEGLCRFSDRARSYRLNFYDAGSFRKALQTALTVPEERIILYIGAHGSKGRIGSANTSTLMAHIAEIGKRKIEGVILSSCEAGGAVATVGRALEGHAHWVFGYKNSVDFIASVQVETAILDSVFHAGLDYTDTDDDLVDTFARGLRCFNPDWELGDGAQPQLRHSVSLLIRPKYKQKPIDATKDLVAKAW
jgi:hypothetical protein